jgi:serine/threonine protein kinase
MGDFSNIISIGFGGFSTVSSAVSRKTNTQVALKILTADALQGTIDREAWCLENILHPNVLHSFMSRSSFMADCSTVLCFEYANCGDCFDLIERSKCLDTDLASDLFGQLVEAVAYLHRNGVVHLDIKTENIMLHTSSETGNLRIKLGDFGLCAVADLGDDLDHCNQRCGSPNTMAPEQHLVGTFNGKFADMWSCGIVLFNMLTGRSPMTEATLVDPLYTHIFNCRHTQFWASAGMLVTPKAQDLINSLLRAQPHQRLCAQGARMHQFFLGMTAS